MDLRGGGDEDGSSMAGGNSVVFSGSSDASGESASFCSSASPGQKGDLPLRTSPDRKPARSPTSEPTTASLFVCRPAVRKRRNSTIEEEKGPGGPCPWGATIED